MSEPRKDACSDGLFCDVLSSRLPEKFDRASHQRAGGWALKLCSDLETWSPGVPPHCFYACGPSVTFLITGTVYLAKTFGRKDLFWHKGKGYVYQGGKPWQRVHEGAGHIVPVRKRRRCCLSPLSLI